MCTHLSSPELVNFSTFLYKVVSSEQLAEVGNYPGAYPELAVEALILNSVQPTIIVSRPGGITSYGMISWHGFLFARTVLSKIRKQSRLTVDISIQETTDELICSPRIES